MKNLIYIDSPDHYQIVSELSALPGKGAHFTNGTYALDAKLIVPTTLAGFKRVTERQSHLPLVIAVNSDVSMKSLGKDDFEPQSTRAAKVAEPVAMAFPENTVIVIYYDEQTPNSLYEALHKHGLTRTLHKWGYGTEPDSPKIEGAELFETTYGFPLPNDIKPVCYHDTAKAKLPQNIIVDDLRDSYISKSGVLFPLPDELQQYSALPAPSSTSRCVIL